MNTYLFDLSVDRLEDDYIDNLDGDIINQLTKKGRLFSCTPLRNLNFKRTCLKKFGKVLSEDMRKIEDDVSVSYNAQFKMLNTSLDTLALKINVDKCRKNQKLGVVYEGLFFTWRKNTDENLMDDINLPFLYCTSGQKYVKVVNSLIEAYFSCTIKAIIFPQMEIKWLLALMLQQIENTDKDIQFVYEVALIQSKFVFYMSFDVLKDLWNSIHDEDTSRINYEEVALLHSSLEEHVINTFGFDLSHFQLKTISVPGFITLDVSGKIQVLKTELLDLLYRFLKDRVISIS